MFSTHTEYCPVLSVIIAPPQWRAWHVRSEVVLGGGDFRPVGFVVNSERTWIARIDLLAMLAAQQGTKVLGPGEMSPFVTFLDPQSQASH